MKKSATLGPYACVDKTSEKKSTKKSEKKSTKKSTKKKRREEEKERSREGEKERRRALPLEPDLRSADLAC